VIAGTAAGAAIVLWALVVLRSRRARRSAARRLAFPPPRRSDSAGVRPAAAPRAQATGADEPDLAASCDRIARELRSGQSLTAALLGAADAAGHPFLRDVAAGLRAGRPLVVAIDGAAHPPVHADVAFVGQVLAVAAEHGGAPAEAIDRAAATLRERAALRAERSAQAASARLSTQVMTVLPLAFTAVVATSDPAVRDVLLGTPLGWTCLTVGAGLNLVGRVWARRVVAQ